MKNNNTKKLAACAVMVALGAVLSMIKVLQMPFGGSITLLSMLPCAMISIMYGLKSGALRLPLWNPSFSLRSASRWTASSAGA